MDRVLNNLAVFILFSVIVTAAFITAIRIVCSFGLWGLFDFMFMSIFATVSVLSFAYRRPE